MSEMRCPCGLGNYAECCQPLHAGKQAAASAEQLMRSRYSAFARHEIDYLVQTTARGQQGALDVPAIAAWSKANQWLQLEVVSANEKLDKTHAQVEFKAHYQDMKQDGQTPQVHHEVSHFVKHQGAWFFLDPTTEMQITMKQPCICGSGKKFKQCCAQYL